MHFYIMLNLILNGYQLFLRFCVFFAPLRFCVSFWY
jgi:hypothetical protein